MARRRRVTGEAGRMVLGTRVTIATSGVETEDLEVTGYDPKTGCNMAVGADGTKYRIYRSAFEERWLQLLPPLTMVYKDQGYEIADV